MARSLLLFLFFALVLPAYAKPRNEKPPVSCTDLWTAVDDTLADPGNYKVVAMDHEHMKANFIVVGALFPNSNMVQLKPRNSGCDLQIRMGFTGNDDEGAFRNRISRTLKKLSAARASGQSGTAQAQ